jgi:hypothetical protein
MRIVKSKSENFNNLWGELFKNSDFQHPLYQPCNIAYYKAASLGVGFEDCSFAVEEGGKPVLGVLAAINVTASGLREFCAYGIMPLFYIEDLRFGADKLSGAYNLFKSELDDILQNRAVDRVFYQDFLSAGKISFVGKYLLNHGASATPFFTQIIDLSDSELKLGQQVRKSYKSLINWGQKNLSLRILNYKTIVPQDMENFRQLHMHAAGRETRPRRTWDLQYEMVVRNEAFAILGELEGELVTAALFPYSSRYCYYGVSASKRELFSKPLSHAVIWRAILHAKKEGCRYFELGMQCYPRQGDSFCSKKELNISIFKHGFGGQTYVRLNIVWEKEKAARIESEE